MLQAGRDRQLIHEFDEQLGMRELRAKVNWKAGLGPEDVHNRFSIQAENCYHPKSIEIVRKYIDSGILDKLFKEMLPGGPPPTDGNIPYSLCVLAASFMTLGCTFPDSVKETLEAMQEFTYQQKWRATKSAWQLKPLARAQMKKAVAEYKNGEPYDFGSKTWLVTMITSMVPGTVTSIDDVNGIKVVNMIMRIGGKKAANIVGPPTDKELGVQPIYPVHVCAACGASKKPDGGPLLVCGGCHERKYCDTTCQGLHLKAHNTICKRPADEMEAFMKSITPIDFGPDGMSIVMGANGRKEEVAS